MRWLPGNLLHATRMIMGKIFVIRPFTDSLQNFSPYSFELHAKSRQEVASCMVGLNG